MAFQEVKSTRSLYQNDVRAQWTKRLREIHRMDECTDLLRRFRTNHVGPARKSYELYHDALWIENAIEQRLAQLKAVELDDLALAERCTTGEFAAEVCARWMQRADEAADFRALEQLAIEYRRNYKPPIMPVNAWLRAERSLATKLMVARSALPGVERIEDLRALRGAKLVGGRDVKMHAVTARFEDGEVISFECGEHEDVISAALREQTILLSQCREGQCATCKAVCGSGDFEFGGGVNVYSLPQEEQDEGLVLLCQTYPRGDLVIDMPYGKDMVAFGARNLHADLLVRVQTFEKVTPGVYRLALEHLNPNTRRARELSYTPGQYVNILIPGTDQWRSFSMTSPPRGDGILEFFVKEIPGGLFSETFWAQARVGLELSARGPYGMFHVNRHSERPRCFFAGGTGIAPVLAMLRSIKQAEDSTPAHLVFAVSAEDAELCGAELRELEQALPSLSIDRVIAERRRGDSTRLQASFAAALGSWPELPDVYVCGPEGLVVAAEAVCRTMGVGVRQIHTEKFLPTGPRVLLRDR